VDAVKSLTEDVSQNVKSTVDVANSDAVGQQQTTVAAVYEQPQLQKTRGWYGLVNSFRVKTETSLTREDWKQVAQALGKSDSYINRLLLLLNLDSSARALDSNGARFQCL